MTMMQDDAPTAIAAALPEHRDAAITALVERLDGANIDVLFDELVAAARGAGERVLMRTPEGHETTGRDFAERLEGLPAALYAQGMRAGDGVLVGVRPGVDALLVLLAVMRVGAMTSVLDPGAGIELFNRRIELTRPKWIIAESLLYAASARTPLRGVLRRRGLELPHLGAIKARHIRIGGWMPGVPRGAIRWSAIQANARTHSAADTESVAVPDPESPTIVFFTSGTTGSPKGVQHSGRSVTAAMRLMVDHFQLPDDTINYNHNLHTFIVAILLGVPTQIAHLKMIPGRWRDEAEEVGATHAFLRPVDAYRLVEHCEQTGAAFPQSLRQVFLYSAPVTKKILERIHSVGHPDLIVTSAYAMTEVIPVAWVDSRARIAWDSDGDLVGAPCPGVEARIDERGELHIRGANVHIGYIGMDTTEWHATGDFARIEDDGSIVLMGRAKDMLIRGKFNLYPGLYEDTIASIPGVAACAIVGVPDPDTADESVVLYVEGAADLPDAEREKLIGVVEHGLRNGATRIDVDALPDYVFIVGELPRAGRANKIDRVTLRERAVVDTGGTDDRS